LILLAYAITRIIANRPAITFIPTAKFIKGITPPVLIFASVDPAVLALMLSLIIHIYRHYGTLDVRKIGGREE